MIKVNSRKIFPAFTLLISMLFIVVGITKYGFWDGVKGPTPGFIPIIVAAVLAATSLLAFVQSFKEEGKPVYFKKEWLEIIAGFSIFGFVFLIGFIPTLFVYAIVWLKVYEKCTWKSTIIVTAVIMAIVIGAFVIWLGVPFPQGIILDTIMG